MFLHYYIDLSVTPLVVFYFFIRVCVLRHRWVGICQCGVRESMMSPFFLVGWFKGS